ncbi:MAG TPA: TetR/AcrR family transcriptional regulator [Solirubrobacterales bacterium]|jgi:AcrR family transcriptional regulator
MAQKTTTRETRERSRARIVDAALELVRERSYAELNVGEIMERAGIGRTLFYRHFDDLADLLLQVGGEAVDELYEAQVAATHTGPDPDDVREAIALPVAVYTRHGPLLRALAEAATADPMVEAHQAELRGRFDRLVEETIRRGIENGANPPPDAAESARALNRLTESYLLETFGREPRASAEIAAATLADIWLAFVDRRWAG